jgi:hypothetical protein
VPGLFSTLVDTVSFSQPTLNPGTVGSVQAVHVFKVGCEKDTVSTSVENNPGTMWENGLLETH